MFSCAASDSSYILLRNTGFVKSDFHFFSRFFEKTFGQSLPCPKVSQNQFASMDSMHAESTSLMMGTHTELPLPASSTITIKASG